MVEAPARLETRVLEARTEGGEEIRSGSIQFQMKS
jgi:hypothetical protein